MTAYDLQGRSVEVPLDRYLILRPQIMPASRAHRNYPASQCRLVVYVARDRSRVFVRDDVWASGREADEVEIEALAERFGYAELTQVLSSRRSSPEGGAPE